jgi:hypothetical protein
MITLIDYLECCEASACRESAEVDVRSFVGDCSLAFAAGNTFAIERLADSSNPNAASCSIAAEVESIETPKRVLLDFRYFLLAMMTFLLTTVALAGYEFIKNRGQR